MKALVWIVGLAGLGLAVTAADGRSVSTVNPGEFDRIYFTGAATFNLSQGDIAALTLTGDESVLDAVTVDVADGVLYIDIDDEDIEREDLKVDVTVVALSEFVSSGSIALVGHSLHVDDLVVEDRGAGTYVFDDLSADELLVASKGAGRFELDGAVRRQVVDLTGAGRYDAPGLHSETSEVHLKGAGRAEVWASQHLAVQIAGAGSVTYAGEPVVNKRVWGAGSVVEAAR